MTVADDVTLDELILAKDDLSGADIKVGVFSLPSFRSKHYISTYIRSMGALRYNTRRIDT